MGSRAEPGSRLDSLAGAATLEVRPGPNLTHAACCSSTALLRCAPLSSLPHWAPSLPTICSSDIFDEVSNVAIAYEYLEPLCERLVAKEHLAKEKLEKYVQRALQATQIKYKAAVQTLQSQTEEKSKLLKEANAKVSF